MSARTALRCCTILRANCPTRYPALVARRGREGGERTSARSISRRIALMAFLPAPHCFMSPARRNPGIHIWRPLHKGASKNNRALRLLQRGRVSALWPHDSPVVLGRADCWCRCRACLFDPVPHLCRSRGMARPRRSRCSGATRLRGGAGSSMIQDERLWFWRPLAISPSSTCAPTIGIHDDRARKERLDCLASGASIKPRSPIRWSNAIPWPGISIGS
jgi:hypothetical protein